MWSVSPSHWFSWDFVVSDASRKRIADVKLSAWRERGAVETGAGEYTVSRRGLLGPFVIERGQSILVSAEKPSAFRDTFQIDHDGKQYTLARRSAWKRELVLRDGGRDLGS